jgi:hypothetical protein
MGFIASPVSSTNAALSAKVGVANPDTSPAGFADLSASRCEPIEVHLQVAPNLGRDQAARCDQTMAVFTDIPQSASAWRADMITDLPRTITRPGMPSRFVRSTVAPQRPSVLAGVDTRPGTVGRTAQKKRLASRPSAPAPNGVASPDHPSQDGSLATARAQSTNTPAGSTNGSGNGCSDPAPRSSQTACSQAAARLAAQCFSLYGC